MYNLKGKHLLVAGGSGSFGSKVATLLAKDCASVTIFSRDEKKQWEMRQRLPDFRYIIGDVRDYASVKTALRNINVIFYAAALKQVPSCEDYPLEALKTNCLGIANVCHAAQDRGTVEKIIYLSTDKAVEPINSMGITKALGEKIIASQPISGPVCCCTRYGNVAGTRGSVLPFWYQQMSRGEKLKITDPRMTRFLMNLKDSVHLVQAALAGGENGDIFVMRAPSLSILALAHSVQQFKKYEAGIEFVGRRPGEKLHECLIHEDELYRSRNLGKYIVVSKDATPEGVQLKAPLLSNTAENPPDINALLTEAELDMEGML